MLILDSMGLVQRTFAWKQPTMIPVCTISTFTEMTRKCKRRLWELSSKIWGTLLHVHASSAQVWPGMVVAATRSSVIPPWWFFSHELFLWRKVPLYSFIHIEYVVIISLYVGGWLSYTHCPDVDFLRVIKERGRASDIYHKKSMVPSFTRAPALSTLFSRSPFKLIWYLSSEQTENPSVLALNGSQSFKR